MDRRRYLALAGVTVAGLTGCTGTSFPGSDPAEDSSATDGCPTLLAADRTNCPSEPDGPLSVDRTSETVSGESWTLGVAVTNRGTEPYSYSPFAWSVFRQAAGGWRYELPAARTKPRVELVPDDRYGWQLATPGASTNEGDQRIFLDLSPGQYAFAVPFRGPDRVAAVASFTVTG